MRHLILIAGLVTLAGCSSGPAGIVSPSTTEASRSVALAPAHAFETLEPLEVLAPPDPLDRWSSPRLRVRAHGWNGVQGEGVSLDPALFGELEVAAGESAAFSWSARPKAGYGDIVAYRWALDIVDITDETPRLGPDDLAHWSSWSATETSATVGPFDGGGEHLFYVETRDSFGFMTLVVVRIVPTD